MSLSLIRGKLFWKYLVVILLLVGTVLTTASVIELYASYEDLKRVTTELEREKAAAVVSRIEQFIEPIAAQVRGTVTASASAELVDKAAEFNRLLRDVPDIAGIQLLDGQGKERLVISRSAPAEADSGVDFSGSAEFQKGRGGKIFHGAVYYRNNTDPRLKVALSSGGKDADVTIAEINLTSIWDAASQVRSGREGYVYIVDGGGRAITHPDVVTSLRRKDLSQLPQVANALAQVNNKNDLNQILTVSTGRDGQSALIAHTVSPTLGWLVFVERPLKEVQEQFRPRLIRPVNREKLSHAIRKICGAEGQHVLLVDDDEMIRKSMSSALEREGWRIGEAVNGKDALDYLAGNTPDIIVLDLMMPEMDGFEFLDQMRRRPEWREIPVLVATAKDLTAEERQRLSNGVDRIIQKHASGRDTILQEVGRTLAAYVKRADAGASVKTNDKSDAGSAGRP